MRAFGSINPDSQVLDAYMQHKLIGCFVWILTTSSFLRFELEHIRVHRVLFFFFLLFVKEEDTSSFLFWNMPRT